MVLSIKKAIPHVLTLSNLFCGVLGVICAFQGSLEWSGYLMGIAAVFDFFDGFAARMLRVPSELGKQLDSLADAVTFGVLPSIVLFQLVSAAFGEVNVSLFDRPTAHMLIAMGVLLVALFSILRLAIFNIDTEQSDAFLGVPTPANALMVASFPIILVEQLQINPYAAVRGEVLGNVAGLYHWDAFDLSVYLILTNPWLLLIFSLVMSALLVVRIPMLSFKFRQFNWAPNRFRYVFLIIVMVAILITFLPYWFYLSGFPYLDFVIVPIIILLYVIYSLIINLFSKSI